MGKINYYVAVFLDVLGQGEKLSKIKRLPQNEQEKEDFFNLFKETTGAVKELHKTFDNYFRGYQRISPEIQSWLNASSEEIREKFLRSKELKLEYLNFSDTVVLYFTLDSENSPTPLRNIYSALSASASTFLMMMSIGIPLRGSINIGIGTIIDRSGLYGPILQSLHHLESKVAEYPRIIVGDDLIKMIEMIENSASNEDDILVKMNKAVIPAIKELISRDADGNNIVHYLDKSIANVFELPHRKQKYNELSEFVDKQCRFHSTDEKLRKRYQQLKNYVRRNKSNWR